MWGLGRPARRPLALVLGNGQHIPGTVGPHSCGQCSLITPQLQPVCHPGLRTWAAVCTWVTVPQASPYQHPLAARSQVNPRLGISPWPCAPVVLHPPQFSGPQREGRGTQAGTQSLSRRPTAAQPSQGLGAGDQPSLTLRELLVGAPGELCSEIRGRGHQCGEKQLAQKAGRFPPTPGTAGPTVYQAQGQHRRPEEAVTLDGSRGSQRRSEVLSTLHDSQASPQAPQDGQVKATCPPETQGLPASSLPANLPRVLSVTPHHKAVTSHAWPLPHPVKSLAGPREDACRTLGATRAGASS